MEESRYNHYNRVQEETYEFKRGPSMYSRPPILPMYFLVKLFSKHKFIF